MRARGFATHAFDSMRLTLLGILASIGATVGSTVAVAHSAWWGLGAGIVSIGLLITLLKERRTSNALIKLMRWVMPLPEDRR